MTTMPAKAKYGIDPLPCEDNSNMNHSQLPAVGPSRRIPSYYCPTTWQILLLLALYSALSSVFLLERTVGGEETNKNHGTSNNAQAPTQGAFESALNEVTQLITDERTKSNINAERTRQDFNLTMWDKKTTGGLKDLDRIKLAAIYRNATSVFEWGLGESSFIAAEVGVPRYTGIDSDPTWIKAARDSSPDHFRFHLGDIGPTGHWGRPNRSRLKKSYLNYQFEPLVSEKAFDVYYVDGRMRPACALVAFLHASTRGDTEEEKSPVVIIHDYYHDKMSQNCSECRKFRWQYPYHRIEEVADLVDHSGAMLAVFKRKRGVTDGEIKALWQEMGLGDT